LDKLGNIDIRIVGKRGEFDLHPNNYDIKDTIAILQQVEALLSLSNQKDRPIITHQLEAGSVKHVFTTAIQTVISFNAILGQVADQNSIDFLELSTAKAFESFQDLARKQNVELKISTSLKETAEIIFSRDTQFSRSEDLWVDTELYFYGQIVDAGGKNKANIHLQTRDFGLLKIGASKDILAAVETNLLYKPYGIRVKGKQNLRTTEFDGNSLQLLEFIDYSPSFKADYLKHLIQKAKKSWADVKDSDEWLKSVRGYGA